MLIFFSYSGHSNGHGGREIPTNTIFKKVLLTLLPSFLDPKMHIFMYFDISEMGV